METGSVLMFFLVFLTTEVIKEEMKPMSLSTLFIRDPDFLASFSTAETPSKLGKLEKHPTSPPQKKIPWELLQAKTILEKIWKLFELEIKILSTFLSC